MNLVKWLRKNNMKVMAVVIIVLMIGFIGGTYISQLGQRGRTDLHKPLAYFADNRKITRYDLALAQQELEILKMLGADNLLRWQDLQGILLGELLFSERRSSPESIIRIKQMIRKRGYIISDKQINDIYRRTLASNIYWLLLKNEVQLVNIRVRNKDAGGLLARTIPTLFPSATYSQVIGAMVNPPPGSNRRGIPEEEILTIFGKLLAVMEYARTVCSNENVTIRQIMHNVSIEEEGIAAEFVKFDSSVFAETQAEPGEEKIVEHFDSYKKFSAGAVSEENPYGFGYKLPDRVGLEYIAFKLDEVSGIVTAPTQEETEEYYQRHRDQYTEQVPSDANDPNSPQIERTKSYADVVDNISKSILQNKIDLKAREILQEAKTITEASLQNADEEPQNLSAEQFRQLAGDYETAVEQLTEKYKIKIYTGETGLLSADDMRKDKILGALYLQAHGYNPAGLIKIAFAIDELAVSELGPFDVPKVRLYENIGPAKDMFGQIVALLRVTKAEKASEPESINQTFSKNTLRIETMDEQASEEVYSVREKVVEDLKKLTAMDTTKSRAEEFKAMVARDGWDGAINKLNELYGQQAKQNEDDPNVFKLQKSPKLRRTSKEIIDILVVQNAGNPAAQFLVDRVKKEGQFAEKVYSLVPSDANCLDTVPFVLEFKPDMSCYVFKEILVKRIEQEEYEEIKAMRGYREDFVQSQTLTAVHFNPENILKRMNFKPVTKDPATKDEETADANTPAESEVAS